MLEAHDEKNINGVRGTSSGAATNHAKWAKLGSDQEGPRIKAEVYFFVL